MSKSKKISLLDTLSLMSDSKHSPLNKNFNKIIKLSILINIFKFGSFFFFLFMMIFFKNFSLGCYLYLSLHGSYGLIWLIKDYYYPDKSFEDKIGYPFIIIISILLLLYFTSGILIIIGVGENNPSQMHVFLCFLIYSIGIFLVVACDIHKNTILLYKQGLITSGIMKNNRNSNFFGEILIYFSFVLCCNHFIAYIIVLSSLSMIIIVRIYTKEKSLREKEGYLQYKNKSFLICFKIYEDYLFNIIFYILMFFLVFIMIINI